MGSFISGSLARFPKPRAEFDSYQKFTRQKSSRKRRFLDMKNAGLSILLVVAAGFQPSAAQEREDLDAYTIRFSGFWFYSQPSGSFHGTGSQGRLDLQSDVAFNSYSTGAGRIEWKFTRKNHLFAALLPVSQSKQTVLTHTVVFQGQTFGAGLATSARLQTYFITPGYQYDIIRRKQGHLGIVAQLDLMYIRGSLKVAAQTLNGNLFSAQASSATLRAPLPVLGPDFRYYVIPNSNRLFVAGNVLGMYFFGYGNFVSSYGTVGVSLNKYLSLQGGYQVSSRLEVKSKTDRIGLNLTQRGAIAGLQVSF
jgi:hypothetical protein